MNPEFIFSYIQSKQGRERFLTYIIYRFLSCAGKEHPELAKDLAEKLECDYNADDFSKIQAYLAEDFYFSPTFEEGTFDVLFLYDAIELVAHEGEGYLAMLDEMIASYAPVVSSLSFLDSGLDLSLLLTGCLDYYAALTYSMIHHANAFTDILPKFAMAYREDFHFTNDDFLLFDFMDEYFEQRNCIYHPVFNQLVDTLVAATLNSQNTDFETILALDAASCLNGTSSRFAIAKRFGSIGISSSMNSEEECQLLSQAFRYAAIYELRNNLFDYHLEEDRLITLENWKDDLRWHYVQYSNVYEMAISSFYATILSQKLLRKEFEKPLV